MSFCAISLERFILASRKIRKCGVRPNLAMRMRIAGTHEFTPVFKDLDVAHPGDLRERTKLLIPGLNHAAQLLGVHSRNGQIVTWRKTQDTADALVRLP